MRLEIPEINYGNALPPPPRAACLDQLMAAGPAQGTICICNLFWLVLPKVPGTCCFRFFTAKHFVACRNLPYPAVAKCLRLHGLPLAQMWLRHSHHSSEILSPTL